MGLETEVPNYGYAVARWPQAPALERLHAKIFGGPSCEIEFVKAFLETVCITILNELGEEVPVAPTTTALLAKVFPALGLVKPKGSSEIGKLISGLNKIAGAIQDVRNENGSVAHGKDGFWEVLEEDLLRAFIHGGDAVLGVLLRSYSGQGLNLETTRDPYVNFLGYHKRIDQAVGLSVSIEEGEESTVLLRLSMPHADGPVELRLAPSAILFGLDRPAYVAMLAVAPLIPVSDDTETEERHAQLKFTVQDQSRQANAIKVVSYSGQLGYLRGGIEQALASALSGALLEEGSEHHLLESILATLDANLALDWQHRQSIRSTALIALKRVLRGTVGHSGNVNEIANLILERVSHDWVDPVGSVSLR